MYFRIENDAIFPQRTKRGESKDVQRMLSTKRVPRSNKLEKPKRVQRREKVTSGLYLV